MRYYVLLLIAAPAWSQPLLVYGYDVHGRRVPMPAPSQKVEDRVLSQRPGERVVERIVSKYDETGRLTGTEKELLEDKTGVDGKRTVRTTVWDSNLNGGFTLRERATTRRTQLAASQEAETLVERPNLTGSLELSEKRIGVFTGDPSHIQSETTVFRKDANGRFFQDERESVRIDTAGNETTAESTRYKLPAAGKPELALRQVSRRSRRADGVEVEVVDIYGPAAAGRVTAGDAPNLREQQVIERSPGPEKTFTETLSIRRTQMDSTRLGPLYKISESVCKGSCTL